MSEVGDSGTVDATAEEVPAAEALRDRIAAVDQALEGADADGRAELEAEREALVDQLTALMEPEAVLTDPALEGSKPAGRELVAHDEADVFRAMDAMDEEQVLDALQGRPSAVMVYSFAPRTGGKKQSGLSFQGVAEVVRTLNEAGHTAIRISPDVKPVIEEYQEPNEQGEVVTYFRVTVYAEDAKNGGGNFGMATQRKFQTFRDKNRKPELDHFALTKALSKAQRNAMLPLTPVVFRETLIAQMLGDATRVRQVRIGAGAEKLAELPPPLTDERAEALKAQARDVYSDLKEVNRLKVLPAAFHQYLSRAEHSHERLEDFVAYLRGQLEEARSEAEAVPS